MEPMRLAMIYTNYLTRVIPLLIRMGFTWAQMWFWLSLAHLTLSFLRWRGDDVTAKERQLRNLMR